MFQFPVIYDTMTVYDNLAFPLRNRGVAETEIKTRVGEIAEMLELTRTLNNRASGLTADGKQKISLGRGLVRSDVNVIMFDEPLTVIDPHLKWQLRSKLKELHLRTKRTMIYVTHDQTEALTFADQVVVMNQGEVVQAGTPVELFEKPQHTFVGHFIGSPGMNVLPCEVKGGKALFGGEAVAVGNGADATGKGRTELGVRPEFVSLAKAGIPAEVVRVADAGRFRIVETRSHGHSIKLLVKEGESAARRPAHSSPSTLVIPRSMRMAGWRVRADEQDRQQHGLVARPARLPDGGVQRAGAADDGRQLFGAGNLRQQRVLLVRRHLVRADPA